MTISYPRTLPTHKGVRSISIRQRKVVGVATAPFSLVSQVYEHPGERWEAEVELGPMNRADAEPWIAWLASLRGPVGSFTMGDPAGQTPRGGAAGSVTGTGTIRGRTLALSGGTGALYAGDWISLGSHRFLHKVLGDNPLPGGTIDIWPSLRATYSGASVAVTAAKGQWMLTDTPQWAIDNASIYRTAFKAVEDLR